MEFSHKIDGLILQSLFIQEKLGFNKILREVKRSHIHLTPRTLSRHLNRLAKYNIIWIDRLRHGVIRDHSLTNNTRQMMLLGCDVRVESKREGKRIKKIEYYYHFSEDKKRSEFGKKLLFILLFLAAIGSPRVRSRVRIGADSNQDDYYEPSEEEKNIFEKLNYPYSILVLPGVSVSDLFLKYRDIGYGWMFQDISFSKREEVEDCFSQLKRFDPPVIGTIEEVSWCKIELYQKGWRLPIEGEARYVIYDKNLSDFLEQCIVLLDEVKSLTKLIFAYRKKGQLPNSVFEWYEFFYGEKKTNEFVEEIEMIRSKIKNKQEERPLNINEKIKNNDINAYALYSILDGDIRNLDSKIKTKDNVVNAKKYQNIHKRYDFITKKIFLRHVYPEFLHDFHTSLMKRVKE